jgi:hypothetical protein
MKTRLKLVALVCIVGSVALLAYALGGPIEIPKPKLSAAEAIKMVEESPEFKRVNPEFLAGVVWSQANGFRPHLSTGSTYFISDAKGEWSWFVTYAVLGFKSNGLYELRVFRVRDNGEVRGVKSMRT